MILIKKPLNLNLFLISLILFAPAVRAEDDIKNHQLHFRTGMLNTTISGGGVTKSYSVSNTIDIEYEVFSNSKNSTSFRATIAQSLTLARTVYAFMGVGKRFYFNSTGEVVHTSGNGFEVDHVPKKRFYYGYDIGYASGVISVFQGTALQTVTSMLDFGGLVGFMYQLSRSNALEGQVGLSYGYGFSGVAGSAVTQRILFGIAHSF